MELFNRLGIPDYALEYLNSLQSKGRKTSTLERYFYDLSLFFEWTKEEFEGELSFDEWKRSTKEIYANFFTYLKDEKNYSDRSLHRVFTVLKNMGIYYRALEKDFNIKSFNGNRLDYQGKVLEEEDFISDEEFGQLVQSIQSKEGLTPNQLKHRHMIVDRNLSIVYMMYYEGLTLNEVHRLSTNNLNFIRDFIIIPSENGERMVEITRERKQLYYSYYQTIPEPVRPKWHSDEPFFVAFHYALGQYWYVFDGKVPLYPKRMTEIGIQRMLQKEVKRARIRKNITSQHLRNTAILKFILNSDETGDDLVESVMKRFGFISEISARRYIGYARKVI